jgi:hypothetical protein
MPPKKPAVRRAVRYHVNFHDKDWNELKLMRVTLLTAHDLHVLVDNWNQQHQRFNCQSNDSFALDHGNETLTIEVEYVEDEITQDVHSHNSEGRSSSPS